jgi:hypothetical protein
MCKQAGWQEEGGHKNIFYNLIESAALFFILRYAQSNTKYLTIILIINTAVTARLPTAA